MKRISIADIASRKAATPIVVLTCYTAPMARLLDPHVDMLLVGDSLGMVVYGMSTTRGVTLDMMIAHGRAVMSASSHALVVVDMPFGSYEESPKQALKNCARVMRETGAQAVKLEGGQTMAKTAALLVEHGIPVIGHVGLLPQSVSKPSGFGYRGKTENEAAIILKDALAIEKAGASAIVIEAVPETLARSITKKLRVPTIGIGASPACDGQVLVIDDILGMGGYVPGFAKQYEQLAGYIEKAVKTFASEVRTRTFPGPEYCFPKKK